MGILKKVGVASAAAAVCLSAAPATAHHSFAMFDMSRIYKWEGTVAQFNFSNPHIHVHIDVKKNPAEAQAAGVDLTGRWDFEGESTAQTTRQGWNRISLKPGDKVTVIGYPVRGQSKGGAGLVLIKPTGETLYFSNNKAVTPETPLKWR